MDQDPSMSRVNKYKKRRSVKRSIIWLSLFGIALILVIIFINRSPEEAPPQKAEESEVLTPESEKDEKDQDQAGERESSEEQDRDQAESGEGQDETGESEEEDSKADAPEKEETDEGEEAATNLSVETREVHSDDPNVVKALEGDWQPIGTEQEEPHTVVFEEDSIDWIEMMAAVESVVTIDDMIVHWLGKAGEQKAVATVSNQALTDNYRVFLAWVSGEGWQPTRVEHLEKLEVIKY